MRPTRNLGMLVVLRSRGWILPAPEDVPGILRHVLITILLCGTVVTLGKTEPPIPDLRALAHSNIGAAISNSWLVIDGELDIFGFDPTTGRQVTGVEFPLGSGVRFFRQLPIYIGAVRGGDTLVSSVMFPDLSNYPRLVLQSSDVTRDFYSSTARAPLEYIGQYNDTVTDPILVPQDLDYGRNHTPLPVLVTTRAMSWTGGNVDDFILFEITIENRGSDILEDMFVGFVYQNGGENLRGSRLPDGQVDVGIHTLSRMRSDLPCQPSLPINAYTQFSLSGAPLNGAFDALSSRHVGAFKWLKLPSPQSRVNYNWYSFSNPFLSPRSIPPGGGPVRPMPNTPFLQDIDFYYLMSYPEHDYNPLFAATDVATRGFFALPRSIAESSARGSVFMNHLMTGPFGLGPGQSATIAFAIVGGEDLHTDPTWYERAFDINNPQRYLDGLDFSDLVENTLWATWVYDNPGIDSDGDGFRGEYYICNGDTVWWKGDGIADWRADVPPPAPFVEILPETGKLTVRWNGYFSETTVDPFTQQQDFEGYRVYIGRDERTSSASLLTSWDVENYNRFELIQRESGAFEWQNRENPFSIDSLETLYGPGFAPLLYTRQTPLRVDGSIYYFEPQDFNVSELGIPGRIRKRFPAQPKPDPDPANWTDDEVIEGPENRRLPKYYEYEYVIDSLLPSVPWYVAVTAFDFGFARGGIPAKESPLLTTQTESYALPSAVVAESENLDVFVYPNPYRVDDNYVQEGFEDRLKTRNPQLERRIHFANLPPKCMIEIYSLDGDRIITINHDEPPGSPNASHAIWNIVSRNRQIVTSGTYYWVVTSDQRTQIGTLVIIK